MKQSPDVQCSFCGRVARATREETPDGSGPFIAPSGWSMITDAAGGLTVECPWCALASIEKEPPR